VALLEDALEREGGGTGWLCDELQVEGHKATLLRGRLTQAEQQRRDLATDRNAGLADAMLRLKEKTKEMAQERFAPQREREELQGDNERLFGELERGKAVEAPAAAKRRDLEARLLGGRGPGRGGGRAQGGGRPAGGAVTGAPGEGRAAGRTKMFEEVEDLTAANVLLQSQARDVERRRAVAEDELEGHQMEEELEEKDFRLERAQEMTTALSAGSIDDPGGIG
jgi:hypothetical protein